jgi:solute:Na+ symporter, SSS family
MTPATIALGIVALAIVGAAALGLYGSGGRLKTPHEYMVGDRSFGSILLWLLMAGEIYTSFTFLGAAGFAYGLGAPAFYILCYGPVAYAIGFFLTPKIRAVGAKYGMLTGPDFFRVRYGSTSLAALVTLVGFVSLVPYVTLQLTGLQVLLSIAGFGAFDPKGAVAIALLLMAAFVFATGLRGTAWASILKDALVLIAVVFAGIALPQRFGGGWTGTLQAVERAHPGWLTLAPGIASHGIVWFVGAVVVSALGFFLWPQTMAATYSAKSGDALRRNAIWLPAYGLVILFVLFAGFAALLAMPGLKGSAADQAFMLVLRANYPPWVLGFVAAAGSLAALVPVTAQLLAGASIMAKNIASDVFGVCTDDRSRTALTRGLVIAVALLALGLWFLLNTYLVNLLLYAYNGIVQFLPGVLMGFWWRRASAWGIGAGIVSGLIVLVATGAFGLPIPFGINAGLAAVAVNAVVAAIVSLLTAASDPAHVAEFGAAGQE